jgi:hypothetical protein
MTELPIPFKNPLTECDLFPGIQVWIEVRDQNKLIGPAIIQDRRPFGFSQCYVWCLTADVKTGEENVWSCNGYGRTWRCWSHKPPLIRRKATLWDDQWNLK